MKPLKDVSIFDIQCGKDRVLDRELCRSGTLDVRTNDSHSEALDVWVAWDETGYYEMINHYHPKYIFLKAKVL